MQLSKGSLQVLINETTLAASTATTLEDSEAIDTSNAVQIGITAIAIFNASIEDDETARVDLYCSDDGTTYTTSPYASIYMIRDKTDGTTPSVQAKIVNCPLRYLKAIIANLSDAYALGSPSVTAQVQVVS